MHFIKGVKNGNICTLVTGVYGLKDFFFLHYGKMLLMEMQNWTLFQEILH